MTEESFFITGNLLLTFIMLVIIPFSFLWFFRKLEDHEKTYCGSCTHGTWDDKCFTMRQTYLGVEKTLNGERKELNKDGKCVYYNAEYYPGACDI